ncbi:hypothetical protein [Cellulomonas sp. JZ18]|nr:hypothetical protein [Cellulomonas sp. JZ18]
MTRTRLLRSRADVAIAQAEDALGRHLERFGARDALVVTWERDAPVSGR